MRKSSGGTSAICYEVISMSCCEQGMLRKTHEKLPDFIQQSLLIRRLDLQTPVLRLDKRDVIRYGLPSFSLLLPITANDRCTHVELHLVAGDLHVDIVKLRQSFINVA